MFISCCYCNRELVSGKYKMSDNHDVFSCVDCENHPALCKQISKLQAELRKQEDEIDYLRNHVGSLLDDIRIRYKFKLPDEITITKEELQNFWSAIYPNGHRDLPTLKDSFEMYACVAAIAFWASGIFGKSSMKKEEIMKRLAKELLKYKKIMGWTDNSLGDVETFLEGTAKHE